MKHNSQIREFWTGLMAGVFLWLAVGALINFHQHYVFGKSHPFQLHAALSFKKEEQKNSQEPIVASFTTIAITSSTDWSVPVVFITYELRIREALGTLAYIAIGAHLLRAPPTI